MTILKKSSFKNDYMIQEMSLRSSLLYLDMENKEELNWLDI